MLKSVFLALFIGLVFIGHSVPAADPTPESLAAIAPFMGDQTVLVAKFDLAKLDINVTVKQWLTPFVVNDLQREILTAVVEQFDGWSNRLKAQGITQFYVVLTIGHMPSTQSIARWRQDFLAGLLANTTYAVIPGASMASIQELHESIQAHAKETWPHADAKTLPDCRQIHGAAVVGMGTLLDQLVGEQPTARPEFETALAAAGNQPICAAVVPPPIFARAVGEIFRVTLSGTNLLAGPILAQGFRWLALGVDPNLDKFNAQLVIQSASPEAATQLADALKRATGAITWGIDVDAILGLADLAQLTALMPTAKGDRLELEVDAQQVAPLRALVKNGFAQAASALFRQESLNHLKQIGLAMSNYYSAHKQFPDRAIRDKNGKPLLSWRVAILPYFEENSLYKEFHLDESWDSQHNRQLIERMPDVYRSPDTGTQHSGRTRYVVPVGEHMMFPSDRGVKVKDVTDGTSKTILVVEVDPDHAVIWTKPDDLEVDLENPRRGLFNGPLPLNTCFADGAARSIRNDVDAKVLRALFTRDGDESIDSSTF